MFYLISDWQLIPKLCIIQLNKPKHVGWLITVLLLLLLFLLFLLFLFPFFPTLCVFLQELWPVSAVPRPSAQHLSQSSMTPPLHLSPSGSPTVSLWVPESMSPSFLFHFLSVELLPLETFHWIGCRWQLLRCSGSLETVFIFLSWLSRFIFLVGSLFQNFLWSPLHPKSPVVLLRCEMAFLFVGHLCLFRVWILLAASLYLWGFEILGW